jgi:hypothetical protein
MTHIVMLGVDDQGNSADWGDHVSDDEYAQAPESPLSTSPLVESEPRATTRSRSWSRAGSADD